MTEEQEKLYDQITDAEWQLIELLEKCRGKYGLEREEKKILSALNKELFAQRD